MAHVFTFNSRQFLEKDERPNPINPIAGEGVLVWLCARLTEQGLACGTPDAEDWGWYADVTHGDRVYLLGASGEWGEPADPTDWTIQLELNRSFWEKLSGANRMSRDDPVSLAIERALIDNSAIAKLEIDRGA